MRLVNRNLTTNEVVNLYRYDHFWVQVEPSQENHNGGGNSRTVAAKDFFNPFDKGSWWKNQLDFWWWRTRSVENFDSYKSIPMMDVTDSTNPMGSAPS